MRLALTIQFPLTLTTFIILRPLCDALSSLILCRLASCCHNLTYFSHSQMKLKYTCKAAVVLLGLD